MRTATKVWLCITALLLAAATAVHADIIVLKSGRRISASEVVDEGERYSYETSAGRMSVRKDLVERVERSGGLGSGMASTSSEMPLVAPRIESSPALEEVARLTIRDGSIDRNYILKLENEAQSGGRSGAAENVAMAHHAAAQFELSKGELAQAIGHYRRALSFAPEHSGLLLNAAHLHLKRSEYTAALEYLERARRVEPDSADVAKLMGWAYYGSNKIEQAVREWERAYKLRPDADVEDALRKARRDLETESGYREGETPHFTLRYNGAAAPELARDLLRLLEQHFAALESDLRFTPQERIGVILYTAEEFFDVTQAPSWSGAINDGRIRIPIKGLAAGNRSISPVLDYTLKHELVHSFVHEKTHGRAPVWLHEGLAMWLGGRRAGTRANMVIGAYERQVSLPLAVMEESFIRMSSSVAAYAYSWSLAVVEYIIEKHGMADMIRILDRLAGNSTTEQAVRDILHMDYPEVEAETIQYLRRAYQNQ